MYDSDNKRLDEWVERDRLDIDKMQLPKKDAKTPVKDSAVSKGNCSSNSRASSPDREMVRFRAAGLWQL